MQQYPPRPPQDTKFRNNCENLKIMSPSFYFLFLFAGFHCTLAFNTGRSDNGQLISELQPLENINEERFRRSVEEDEKLISVDDKNIEKELITDEQIMKAVEEQQLPEGEYEEIPTTTEVGSRTKRATVTIIRVRNRRTGKVAYIVIRRK